MTRPLFLVLPAALLLAACTPPPDSATRGGAEGLRVQLTEPRTCLDGLCILYDDRLGRVQQRGRETVHVPEEMVDAGGYVAAADFRELLDRTRFAVSINGSSDVFTSPEAPASSE